MTVWQMFGMALLALFALTVVLAIVPVGISKAERDELKEYSDYLRKHGKRDTVQSYIDFAVMKEEEEDRK